MDKIKNYEVVSGLGTDELNKLVNLKIRDGWQPFGSASMLFVEVKIGGKTAATIRFSQAMVK